MPPPLSPPAPLHLGRKQSPLATVHSTSPLHGPREGLTRAKHRWDLDTPDRAVKHTPMQRVLFFSTLSLSHTSCLQDRSSLMSSQPQPGVSTPPLPMVWQSSSHMHPNTISLGAPETSSDCAFPSCSLCCHLQPHDSTQGLAWVAHPRGTHLIWDAGLSLFSCRNSPQVAE